MVELLKFLIACTPEQLEKSGDLMAEWLNGKTLLSNYESIKLLIHLRRNL